MQTNGPKRPVVTAETGAATGGGGAVLSPVLLLLHINDLKTVVPNDVEVAMFADDFSLLCNHSCKLRTQAAMKKPSHESRSRNY